MNKLIQNLFWYQR